MFWWDFYDCMVGLFWFFIFFNVPVNVVMVNADYLDPQNIFLFYIFYDVNCEWAISLFVFLLGIYVGASEWINSIDLHFIKYENSAENSKIDTNCKRWNFIEINQRYRSSCHLSFCSDAIFRTALLILCKMILSKNSAARKRAGTWHHISLKCIHC